MDNEYNNNPFEDIKDTNENTSEEYTVSENKESEEVIKEEISQPELSEETVPTEETPSTDEISQNEAPQAEPAVKEEETASVYAYTATSNPDINKDAPQGGIRTTFVSNDTNVSEADSHDHIQHSVTGASKVNNTNIPNPAATPTPAKKKAKSKAKLSASAVALILAASLVFSAIFGLGGVYVGYKLFSDGSGIVTQNKELNTNVSTNVVADAPEGSVAAAAETAANAVVEITTETVTTSFFYGDYVQSGAGSGVIIDAENGYIITCAHVISGASTVEVTLRDGTIYAAEIIGSDSDTDIAVIQIEPKEALTAASLGDSDTLVVGQTAIAIGNPLGTLGGTVTSGIISALNREINIDGQDYSLLQIDTSINPGNSGGGLFDIAGNLIGIVNAKSSADSTSSTTIEGLGFAIPVNKAVEICKDLVEQGYVGGRLSLGIYVYEYTKDSNLYSLYQSGYYDLINYISGEGVYFLEYQTGQNGGFKFGDRIVAIDGVEVAARNDITSLLEEYELGDTVTVTVSRMNTDQRRSQMTEVEVSLIEYVPSES